MCSPGARAARPFRRDRRGARRRKRLPAELVLAAAETGGRVRLAHGQNNDEGTVKRFAGGCVAITARVVTDGLASRNARSLGARPHAMVAQTKPERRENDALQNCHWTISLLKRWLLGTHGGAVREKHLQAYLDEFAFRHNRRKTNGVARVAARVIERLVATAPLTLRQLVRDTEPCRLFRPVQAAARGKGIGMSAEGDAYFLLCLKILPAAVAPEIKKDDATE